jgi:hypothetical protein
MGYHVERGAPMSIRIALAASALFAAVAWTPPARATPSAPLVYSRGAGTDECPDETADKTIVASVGETPRRSPRVAFTASVGAVVSLAVAPAPATGLSIGGEARWRQASLGVEARIDAPASHTFLAPSGLGLETVSLSSWLVTATVGPCVHARALIGCALGQLGSVQASALEGSARSAPWLAAGARVGAAVPLGGGGALRLRADLLANLDRAEIWIDAAKIWKAPLLCASYGLDVVVPF